MLYLTGIRALNCECELNTFGDWHSIILSKPLKFKDSNNSIFKDFGIELNKKIKYNDGTYNVANHIRACLDLLEDGKFGDARGMANDFICTEEYNDIIFAKVSLLKKSDNWKNIDNFMLKEYKSKWLKFKKETNL